MARETRQRMREAPRPKPVEKVELSEKNIKLRTVLTVLLLLIGAAGIAFGVSSCLSSDPGWAVIEVASADINCSRDFTLIYDLGADGTSATAEKRALTARYTQAATDAYRLFTRDEEFEGLANVAWFNSHPNEETTVDPGLYRAFARIRESGDRSLYLAPVYVRYDDLFNCTDDADAASFDPLRSAEAAEEYAAAAAYANDSAAVDLELLDGNRVRLKVSEEYLRWAKENAVEEFIDFFWMKNAFIADYLAEVLIDGGFTHGSLSSYDGFSRNLDNREQSYSFSLSDRVGNTLIPAAVMDYNGPMSLVHLRDYALTAQDGQHYYTYRDGETRGAYLDAADAMPKAAGSNLLCFSREKSCAQVLLETIPLYVTDTPLTPERAAAAGVSFVLCGNDGAAGTVTTNDPAVKFRSLYAEDITYRENFMG